MDQLVESFGEGQLLLASGAVVGVVFGLAAYHSRFCLRAAVVEVTGGSLGPRLAIWLVAFFAALASVQLFVFSGALDVSEARQLAGTGSFSGAIIGGLLFGAGMILARGCVSRLLVLSASGNLRAIMTGLVVTLVAQASLRGVLSPARESLASLWAISGGQARNLATSLNFGPGMVTVMAVSTLVLSLFFGWRQKVRPSELAAAASVGLAVCAGWVLTYVIAAHSFEVVAVQSVTFTGPSTDTLMALVNERGFPLSFGAGLVPGVFSGALLAALIKREARIQRFEPDVPMERYLAGGVLMGFGSMLAGGCAVGAGMAGGSIFAVTAWLAVFCMWLGAMATQWFLSGRRVRQAG